MKKTARWIWMGTAILAAGIMGCGPAGETQAPPEEVQGKMDPAADEALIGADPQAVHYQATHCEIFIDKVVAFAGSHGQRAVKVYVKTLNDRLDGEIAEVGFRGRRVIDGQIFEEWQNKALEPYWNAPDYFGLSFTMGGDYQGLYSYEGAFFVKTINETYYWFKPTRVQGQSENFIFDLTTYHNTLSTMGVLSNYNPDAQNGVSTQQASMSYFNPAGCY